MDRTSPPCGKSHRGPNMSQTTSKRILHLLARQLGVSSDDPAGIVAATQIHREHINWERIGIECNIQKQLARKHFNEVIKPRYESFGSVMDAKDKAEFVHYIITLLYDHHYPSASMLERFTPSSGHRYSRVILRRAFHNIKKSRTLQECYKTAGYTFSNLLSRKTLPYTSKSESTGHKIIAGETSAQTSSTSGNTSLTVFEESLTPSLGAVSLFKGSRSTNLSKSLDLTAPKAMSYSKLPLPSTLEPWRETAFTSLSDVQRLSIDNSLGNIPPSQYENEPSPHFAHFSPAASLQSFHNTRDIFSPEYQMPLQWQRSYPTLHVHKSVMKSYNSWAPTYSIPTTFSSQSCATRPAFALPLPLPYWTSNNINIPFEHLAQAHSHKLEDVVPLSYELLSDPFSAQHYLPPGPLPSGACLGDLQRRPGASSPFETTITYDADQSHKAGHPPGNENDHNSDPNPCKISRPSYTEMSSISSSDHSYLEPSTGGTETRVETPAYKMSNQLCLSNPVAMMSSIDCADQVKISFMQTSHSL